MKSKRLMVGMLVVFFMALTTTVFAFGPRGGGYGQCGGFGMAANLNLSKDQVEKMWQIKEKYHTDTQKARYEVFQKGIELRALYADPKANDAAILAKQKELSALRQKLQDRRTQMRLEQRKVLTPEQLGKLNEFQQGYGRMGYGMGKHGRGYGLGGY